MGIKEDKEKVQNLMKSAEERIRMADDIASKYNLSVVSSDYGGVIVEGNWVSSGGCWEDPNVWEEAEGRLAPTKVEEGSWESPEEDGWNDSWKSSDMSC